MIETDREDEFLGKKVKDKLTGLTGIATARCFYIHGCDHIGIQPPADNKTGRVPPLVWVDSPVVEVVERRKIKTDARVGIKKKRKTKRGGPAPHPPGRPHPSTFDSGYHG